MLIRHGQQLQLATKPNFKGLLEKVVKAELHEALTPAGLETLSIITYGGPILRSEIDYIRGVNSSFILRALLLRGLINRNPDPRRGNAYLYGPSFDFLKHLGGASVTELPDYQVFAELAMKVKQPLESVPVVTTPLEASSPMAAVPKTKLVDEPIAEKSEELAAKEESFGAAPDEQKKPKKQTLSDEIAEMFQGQQKAPEGLEASEFDGNPEIE